MPWCPRVEGSFDLHSNWLIDPSLFEIDKIRLQPAKNDK